MTHTLEPSPLRQMPQQARARKTVELLLDVAGQLLCEQGWNGFNTNLLAERAGCRVATVYRYFPDKLAIITTLAQRTVANWDSAFSDFDESLRQSGDLRTVWPLYLDRFVGILQNSPDARAVRKAMQAVPSLRALDQADNARLAELMAQSLIDHIPQMALSDARISARLLIETAVTMIDLAMDSQGPERAAYLAALKRLHHGYVNPLYNSAGGV